jgi:hypothetical protein
MKCCRDCPDRGCGAYHDKCEKYQAEVNKNRITNSVKLMEGEKNSMGFLYQRLKKLRRS